MNLKKRAKILQLAYGEMAPHALQTLSQHFKVCAIITPSLTDRSHRQPLPVEVTAKKLCIPIIRDSRLSTIEQAVKKYQPQAIVIASYDKIIPAKTLNLTKFINIHHGDLPRWRGRANINWAIILGKKYIGLTIHQAIPDLDAGAIYAQYRIPITDSDTVATIYAKINVTVKAKISTIVKKVLLGFQGRPQRGQPTYCVTRLPQDGLIDWHQKTIQIDRLIRALTKPYPGAFTYVNGKKLIIWIAETPQRPRRYVGRIPGRIALLHPDGVEVLTGDSSLILKTVNYAGYEGNARDFIATIKLSLGINWVELYEHCLR